MPHPVDDAKLGRVRELMAESELDAFVVRAPDNGLYLTDHFWEGGGGLRLEDNFLVTDDGPEKLCRIPEDFRP